MPDTPRTTLAEVRAILDNLSELIRHYANALRDADGSVSHPARSELNAQAEVVDRWTAWMAERDRLDAATDVELIGLMFELAGAGCQSLQVLGAHFAKNGKWG